MNSSALNFKRRLSGSWRICTMALKAGWTGKTIVCIQERQVHVLVQTPFILMTCYEWITIMCFLLCGKPLFCVWNITLWLRVLDIIIQLIRVQYKLWNIHVHLHWLPWLVFYVTVDLPVFFAQYLLGLRYG